MEIKLVGVHRVIRKRGDGTESVYIYAWRGGPRMTAKEGTKAFIHEYVRLTKDKPDKSRANTFGEIIDHYLKSAVYTKLKPSTKRDYDRIIGAIRAKYGTLPTKVLDAKGIRRRFREWRDGMSDTPRSADLHMAVLARILAWAKDQEYIKGNAAEAMGRLHKANRKNAIWMPWMLEKLFREGKPHLVKVAMMALWTMQRQGDLLTMPVLAYDGDRLWITQEKTQARVKIRPASEIIPIILEAKEAKRQRILVNSFGQNWSSDGFRSSWSKEMKRLGIDVEDVTFHDLRGTAISFAYANGMDVKQIADITGHSKAECEAIIRKHYLAGGDVIEAIRAGTGGKQEV